VDDRQKHWVEVDGTLLSLVRSMYVGRSNAEAIEFVLRDFLAAHSAIERRERPSQKLRVAAALLRTRSDRDVGRRTPQWIVDLATKTSPL